MILISACLVGVSCKYSGNNNYDAEMARLYQNGGCLLICPEQFGNLPTPRPPSEIQPGFDGANVLRQSAKVFDCEGTDVTSSFVNGAQITLALAKAVRAERVYLKEGSPSCGCTRIYDGTFCGQKKRGMGVTASLLVQNNILVKGVE